MHAVIVIGALFLLVGLLIFVKKEFAKGILLTKPSLSILFVIVALTAPSANPTYFNFVLAGLLFCVAGDVLLIFPAKELFLAGLVSFLATRPLQHRLFHDGIARNINLDHRSTFPSDQRCGLLLAEDAFRNDARPGDRLHGGYHRYGHRRDITRK